MSMVPSRNFQQPALIFLIHTIGGTVGPEEIREQALLDGGGPTQGLLIQDEQEAVELHQELVQHCKQTDEKVSEVEQSQNSVRI